MRVSSRASMLACLALGAICLPSLAARAQTTINQTFTYTGSNQFFVVPTGVTSLTVYIWGAGGGGGVAAATATGGGGAFVSGNLSVTPGDTLTLLVGGGGLNPLSSSNPNTGGFGGGGNSGDPQGGGGGRSGVLRGSVELVDAGAGGGGGNNGLAGGAGGVTNGQAGTGNTAGGGGTQTGGGAGGVGNFTTGAPGTAFQGGSGVSGTNGGAGGGGGYFGGGGGGENVSGLIGFPGAGGGGSSYTRNSLFTLTVGQDGNGATPGGTANAFYLAGVGVGGAEGMNGGNGEVALSYVVPAAPAVPEPGSVALLVGLAVTGAGFLTRRKRTRLTD